MKHNKHPHPKHDNDEERAKKNPTTIQQLNDIPLKTPNPWFLNCCSIIYYICICYYCCCFTSMRGEKDLFLESVTNTTP